MTLKRTGNSNTAVVGWGRGMGHRGHMFLASSVITHAKDLGADPYFLVSRTVGKDDPIHPAEKLALYRKVFPKYAAIFQSATDDMPDLTGVLRTLNQMGYKNAVVVVGADQDNAMQYVKNYNKRPNKAGEILYQFDNLQVIARQQTSDPSKDEEGPRATPMREILLDPRATDQQKFKVWRSSMSPEITDKEVRTLMNKATKRLAPKNAIKEGIDLAMAESHSVSQHVQQTNRKIAENCSNPFKMISADVYNHRGRDDTGRPDTGRLEFQAWRRDLLNRMNEDGCPIKYQGSHRFLSEMMNGRDTDQSSVIELLSKAFNTVLPPEKLTIGTKGDVVVISTMPGTKRVEIDVHHAQTITDIKFINADDCYKITTSGGLKLPSSWRDDLIETQVLFVENIGEVDKQLTWLRLKVQPDWNGWKFSILSDKSPIRVAEGVKKFKLNLESIEKKFGIINLHGVVQNNQKLLNFMAKSNIPPEQFFGIISEKIDKVNGNILSEGIVPDTDITYIFDQFNKFSSGNRVASGDKVSVLDLEALSLGNSKIITLSGKMTPTKIVGVNNSYVTFASGEQFPKPLIKQVRMWRQVIFFNNQKDAEKCLTMMSLLKGQCGDWTFNVEMDRSSDQLSEDTQLSKPIKPFSQVKQYPLDALLTGMGSGQELKRTPEYRREKQVNSYRATMADRVKAGYTGNEDEGDWDN